jgi:nickel-type superoxide dismutase maturation protease
MSPTLSDGDHVLVAPSARAEDGDIVLCRHPHRRDTRIIKRLIRSTDMGMSLSGDNPAQSTDSASFGAVPWALLIGRVSSRM